MKALTALARELAGLFVDDGSLALAIIAWLAVTALLAGTAASSGGTTLYAGPVLFAGLALILVENAWRRARKPPS
jgi:TRAP-type C4-dicarboxylate transport system permease small subunit